MQQRFRFRLQKLLHLREQEVEAARRRLADCLARLQAARHGWDALREHRRHRQELAAAGERSGMDAATFAAWRLHLAQLLRAEEAAAAEVGAAEAAVAEARQELVARRRAALVLERLRDRRREQWQLELARRSQGEADELASIRHGLAAGGWPGGKE